jgi:hypothetical protein
MSVNMSSKFPTTGQIPRKVGIKSDDMAAVTTLLHSVETAEALGFTLATNATKQPPKQKQWRTDT